MRINPPDSISTASITLSGFFVSILLGLLGLCSGYHTPNPGRLTRYELMTYVDLLGLLGLFPIIKCLGEKNSIQLND